jgi:hypothetical protein
MLDELIAAVAAEVGATRVTVPAELLPEVSQMNGKVRVEAGAPGDRCIRYYMGTKLVQAQVP